MAHLVYIAIAWLVFLTTPAKADPFTVGTAILGFLGQSAFYGATAILVGQIAIGAALIGGALLASSLTAPRIGRTAPTDRQATIRQSLGPRLRYYGRVMVGGTIGFFENKDGYLYQLMTLNEGRISAIQQIWLNDGQVTLDANGYVQEEQYDEGEDENGKVVRIFFKMGEANQTVHSQLDAAFTEVTPNHRMRGVANCLAIFQEVDGSEITKVYPQLNPNVRVVMDASILKSVRTGADIWSDNPADAVYDYLVGVDGAGFAYGAGYHVSQIDKASFEAFADMCDEAVPLKAGGTIKRYRLWDGYSMAEQMRDVLPRLLRPCDGDLYLTTEGKIGIRGGKWVPPVLTLDSAKGHIVSADLRKGQQALAAFNELTITYTEPNLDYQETEAERWLDVGNIAMRGAVLTDKLDVAGAPHHAQARRLGKIYTHKNNPEWSGTVVTNFYGFNAIDEETVTIKFDPLGIETTFLINSVRILEDMTGVELNVTSLSASAYAWDAELEEGTAPGTPPDTTSPITLDPPEDINVSVARRTLGGGGSGAFLLVTWTEPERKALEQEVEYRTSGQGTWVSMAVSDGAGLAESSLVNEDVDYDVRVRTRSPAGMSGDWQVIAGVTATPDTSAPDPVVGLTATPSSGQTVLEWMQPDSTNAIGARVYRNTINDSGSATLLGTVYGSPETDQSYTDTVSAGTYYYWVAAVNGSNFVASDLEATGAVVVP